MTFLHHSSEDYSVVGRSDLYGRHTLAGLAEGHIVAMEQSSRFSHRAQKWSHGYQRLDYTISFLICSESLGASFAAKTVLLLCTEFFSIDVEDHLRIYVAYHANGKTIQRSWTIFSLLQISYYRFRVAQPPDLSGSTKVIWADWDNCFAYRCAVISPRKGTICTMLFQGRMIPTRRALYGAYRSL